MKGFGLRGAALVGAIAFSLAAPALAGSFAWSARPAHAPGAERIRLMPSPSHRDKHAGRSELELGVPVYATSDTESAAPSAIPAPVAEAPFFFYPSPGYAPHSEVAERHGPRIIYIGRDEAPPSPAVGPKIIYGDELAPINSDVRVIYGDQ